LRSSVGDPRSTRRSRLNNPAPTFSTMSEEEPSSFEAFLVEEACTNVIEEVGNDGTGQECKEMMKELAKGEVDPSELSEEAEERLGEGAFDAIQGAWNDITEEFN